MDVTLARQAIYNTTFNIEAFELFYRQGSDRPSLTQVSGDTMTRRVLSQAFTLYEFKELTGALPVFVNFTRNLLVEDFALMFDPKKIILEVPAKISIDETLLRKLRSLQAAGYRLCLNSYTPNVGRVRFDSILPLFDVIRVDIRGGRKGEINHLQLRELSRKTRASGCQLLAEFIEQEEEFALAQTLGFDLFQGYYLEKPVLLTKQISLDSVPCGRLFAEIQYMHFNTDRMVSIICSDPELTHLILYHYLHANYNWRDLPREVRRCLALATTGSLRHWVAAVTLRKLNAGDSEDLSRIAFRRGLFIEQLMSQSTIDLLPERGFLLGVMSGMEEACGVPTEEILSVVTVDPRTREALLGLEGNIFAHYLYFARSYEQDPDIGAPRVLGLTLKSREIFEIFRNCDAEASRTFAAAQDEFRVVFSAIYGTRRQTKIAL